MVQELNGYYSGFPDEVPKRKYHKVIALHHENEMTWDEVLKVVPSFPRGWFELARLSQRDRIDFTRDFWLATLPYNTNFHPFLTEFFALLEDVGIFITQKKYDDPLHAHIVYSLSNNRGFFHGDTPILDTHLAVLQDLFPDHILPVDYLAFLKIHDGFSKATDCTGIIRSTDMLDRYKNFQSLLASKGPIPKSGGGAVVNPKTLIPFYESFGMPFYQCFWGEWYPEQEMGNVYYSAETNTISEIRKGLGSETLSFANFLDWLKFYLEQVE